MIGGQQQRRCAPLGGDATAARSLLVASITASASARNLTSVDASVNLPIRPSCASVNVSTRKGRASCGICAFQQRE
jgi:hypothetical protein